MAPWCLESAKPWSGGDAHRSRLREYPVAQRALAPATWSRQRPALDLLDVAGPYTMGSGLSGPSPALLPLFLAYSRGLPWRRMYFEHTTRSLYAPQLGR